MNRIRFINSEWEYRTAMLLALFVTHKAKRMLLHRHSALAFGLHVKGYSKTDLSSNKVVYM